MRMMRILAGGGWSRHRRNRQWPLIDRHPGGQRLQTHADRGRQRCGKRHRKQHPSRLSEGKRRLEPELNWVGAEHGPRLLVGNDEAGDRTPQDHSSAPSRQA